MSRGLPLLNVSGQFVWTEERTIAATMLAEGETKTKVCDVVGIAPRTLYYWLDEPQFAKEVDNLTMMYGLASRKERLRIINKMAKQFVDEEGNYDISGFSFLDLLKEARMQTEGINLNVLSQLTALTEEDTPASTERSRGTISLLPEEAEETE